MCQIDTYEAQERYLSSRDAAYTLYGDYCLTNAATSLFEIPEAKVFLKALQRKKVMIQRDIEKDAFYREALFHDDAKADWARSYLALLNRQALYCLPKTMPCGSRLLLSSAMTSRLASTS